MSFGATIAQSGTQFQTTLTGTAISSVFTGSVSGQNVEINFIQIGFSRLGADIFVSGVGGTGTVRSNGTIVGTFNGSYSPVGAGASCNAFDHVFQFTRR
jgi:hypothetical protein